MAAQLLEQVRAAFNTGRTRPICFRRQQLQNLLRMLDECREEIVESLHKDLRRPKFEGNLCGVEPMKYETTCVLRQLDRMTKDEKLPFNALTSISDSAFIHKDPFGVVLILGAWNFPFITTLYPLLGAIAAGNGVVLKPSEITSHCSATIARILPRYIDRDCYKVFEGDVNASIDLLTLKFDYIFATGSTIVGKSVMAAAAKHLTPVTLELGGKNPVYIDDDVDIYRAAKRILWGKFLNLGQVCVAPDYVLLSKKRLPGFLDACSEILAEFYGKKWQENQDLSRIVNGKHFNRLKKILDATKGRIAIGGETDEKDLWISPTIVVDVDPSTDSTMEDEVFGPILPIITVESADAALKLVLGRPKPLVLYIFSEDKRTIDKFLNQSSSGGVCVNDVVLQLTIDGLPFGGVGNSGMGKYHGKYSIDTFSHQKAVLIRSISSIGEKMTDFRYAPYNDKKLVIFQVANRILPLCEMYPRTYAIHAITFLLGLAVAYFFL